MAVASRPCRSPSRRRSRSATAQSTGTTVNLRNYYLDLRVAAGSFDAYGRTGGQGAGVTFTAPTVFIYTSDNVRNPTTTTGRNAGTMTQQSSVWTELINTTPTGTAFTGLTAAGQTFVDPAGGPTITLMSISATGAVVPGEQRAQHQHDGRPASTARRLRRARGPTTCGPVNTADGGVIISGMGGAHRHRHGRLGHGRRQGHGRRGSGRHDRHRRRHRLRR